MEEGKEKGNVRVEDGRGGRGGEKRLGLKMKEVGEGRQG